MDTFEVAKQKRRSYRVRVDWTGTLETARGPVEATVRDISPEGAYIRCDQPLKITEPLRLTIRPPEREPIRVTGTVVWADCPAESTGPQVLGLRFTAILPEDRRFLEHFTSKQLRAKISSAA